MSARVHRVDGQAAVPEDERVCQLCQGKGDCEPQAAGRLLNMDAGSWLHVNCALWSSEVGYTLPCIISYKTTVE